MHHACARERFGSQNRKKLTASEHFWKFKSAKFAPRLRETAIWKSKSLKTEGSEHFWKLQSAKFAPRLSVFYDFDGSKCFSRGRRRDFDTFQNAWQAQDFVRVAKTLAGVVDLKGLRNDAFRVAGARISCFAMSMFKASDAESVEGLHISCHGSVTLQ